MEDFVTFDIAKKLKERKLFNSKIIGAKEDAPQGKQSDRPKDNKTD